jgi:hypothetical protein
MNPKNRLKTALLSIADHEVPETTNLWPKVAARLKQKESTNMNPKLKLAWTLALVLLALALATGVAYAIYNYFKGDPGMESVTNAGLVTNLKVTALPTTLPTPTAPAPASTNGTAQTLKGVTLTLNWIYLEDGWQSFGFHIANLTASQHLGEPILHFGALTPLQYRGAAMTLTPADGGLDGKYVAYQIVRNDATYMISDTFTDFALEIPLLAADGTLLDTFRYVAPHEQIHIIDGSGGGNLYSTDSNGMTMSVEWTSFTPHDTRARICYDRPDLKLEQISLQASNETEDVLQAPALAVQKITPAGNGCVEAVFAPLAPDATAIRLLVNSLKDKDGTDFKGTWEVILDTLPSQVVIPGITPRSEKSIGNVKITLIQAYVDAARAAVVFRIDGWETKQMPGNIEARITDENDKPFNASSSMSNSQDDPNQFSASFNFASSGDSTFSPNYPLTGDHFNGKLVIDLRDENGNSLQTFKLDLNLPLGQAKEIHVGQTVTANGVQMRLEMFKISPSYTYAYICYKKPSPEDWQFSWNKTSLKIGETEGHLDGGMLLSDSDMDLGKSPEPGWKVPTEKGRCIKLGFPVGMNTDKPETLTLTIDRLELSPNESGIPNDQLQTARQKLREQGIEIDWITQSGNGGGGAGPSITKKPDGMTDQEVLERFYDAFGYYFKGPWVFTVEIK